MNIFLPFSFIVFEVVQKIHLIETVPLNIHNICFDWEIIYLLWIVHSYKKASNKKGKQRVGLRVIQAKLNGPKTDEIVFGMTQLQYKSF